MPPGGMPPNPSYVVALEKTEQFMYGQKLGHGLLFPLDALKGWRYN